VIGYQPALYAVKEYAPTGFADVQQRDVLALEVRKPRRRGAVSGKSLIQRIYDSHGHD
jgi:hypothetical protein